MERRQSRRNLFRPSDEAKPVPLQSPKSTPFLSRSLSASSNRFSVNWPEAPQTQQIEKWRQLLPQDDEHEDQFREEEPQPAFLRRSFPSGANPRSSATTGRASEAEKRMRKELRTLKSSLAQAKETIGEAEEENKTSNKTIMRLERKVENK